jgi:hypothetical protein
VVGSHRSGDIIRILAICGIAVAILCSCGRRDAPEPSQTTAVIDQEPRATSSLNPATEGSGPAATVAFEIPIESIRALAAASGGVFYARTDGQTGLVGEAGSDGRRIEVPVGPNPAALGFGYDSLFVAEGTGDRPGQPRQNLVERLDPKSLDVVASVAIESPSDLLVRTDGVWVSTTSGELFHLRPSDLAILASRDIDASGPTRLASSATGVWVLGGRSEPPAYVLARIDPRSLEPLSSTTIHGGGVVGALASGDATWVATFGAEAGAGELRRVADDASLGQPMPIGAPAALVEAFGRVWWIAVDGRVGAFDEGVRYDELRVGPDASAAVASGDLLWVAADTLVALRPLP